MTHKSVSIIAVALVTIAACDDDSSPTDLGGPDAASHDLAVPAPMSIPTSRTTAGVAGGGGGPIYVLGGVGAAYLPAVEVLDPQTGMWQKRAIMTTARAGLGAAV